MGGLKDDLASVDALISFAVYLKELMELSQRMPVVCMRHRLLGPELGCVLYDWRLAMLETARHLLERRHRSIALFTREDPQSVVGVPQIDGLRLGLVGTDARFRVIDARDWDEESGAEAARKWCDQSPRETAVICGSDEIAVGVYRELQRVGLRVPGDVAFVSVGGSAMLADVSAKLTMVRIPWRESARAGAREVLRLLDEPGGEGRVLRQELELRIGDSTPYRND